MNYIKQHKTKIILTLIVIAALVFTYLFCAVEPASSPKDETQKSVASISDSNKAQATSGAPNAQSPSTAKPSPDTADENIKPNKAQTAVNTEPNKAQTAVNTEPNKAQTAKNTEPKPNKAQTAEKSAPPTNSDQKSSTDRDKAELHCTISVRCDTALKNISRLSAEKSEIVPKDGVILAEREVVFYEGESVFNVLVRETKKNKIHMEFVKTPIYNSAYIEGIGNLYEFDCGELSGWLYRVNGSFPSYGSSRYILKDGDRVEWLYSCDLGKDIGCVFEEGASQRDE